MYECQICNQSGFQHPNSFSNHLKIHKLNGQQYYDQYILRTTPLCKQCDNEVTKFKNWRDGYSSFCSQRCANIFNMTAMWKSATQRKTDLSNRLKHQPLNIRGRLKGSKNKQPYPRSEAVIERWNNNRPPSWKGKTHSPETKQKMSDSRIEYIEQHGMKGSYKGFFVPKNPNKYKGDVSNIVFRSSWELKFMNILDTNTEVVYWASEPFPIPYRAPKDGKIHRYFVDFLVATRNKTGKIETSLIEIKPHIQTIPPKQPKKISRRFITEQLTYETNQAKWRAAREVCSKQGWTFRVADEYDLGIKPRV